MSDAADRAGMNAVQCDFCYHRCRLSDGKRGICGVREARNGRMETTVYGRVAAAGIDPIEKKPLYHVFPGSRTLSVALPGCNLSCKFCQNHALSQHDPDQRLPTRYTSPHDLVESLAANNLSSMTYTYSDPVVWQDFMLDTARLVKERDDGINCMVTNGTMTEESLQSMRGLIDAFNIDVKGDEDFYRRYCHGSLKPVLRSVESIIESDMAVVEVTTLVIEGIHTAEGIRKLGKLLHDLGVSVWHLTRFFPAYLMGNREPTSELFLKTALQTAAESGIPHIYSGNSAERDFVATVCPHCKTVLIPSHSYLGEAGAAAGKLVKNGRCCRCGERLYGLYR